MEINQVEEKPQAWLDSTAAKFTGAGIAVGATLLTARDAINRAFFKSMNKGDGAFLDLQNARDNAINHITAPAKHGKPVPNAMEKVHEIVVKYDHDLAARRKLLGIHNVFDEMKALKQHQWLEVLFATGAVASVAVGAILAITSGRSKVKRLEEEQQQGRAI